MFITLTSTVVAKNIIAVDAEIVAFHARNSEDFHLAK